MHAKRNGKQPPNQPRRQRRNLPERGLPRVRPRVYDSPMELSKIELLNEAQTAELLGVAPGTLTDWRGQRIGPPWVKMTNRLIRYRRADVEKWLSDRTIDPGGKPGNGHPPLPPASPVHPFLRTGKPTSRLGGHRTMAERRGEDNNRSRRHKTMADRRAEDQAQAHTL